MMEYKHFLPLIARYLPAALAAKPEFKDFLQSNGPSLIYELSDFLVMTLPSPRIKYYQSSDYTAIQSEVVRYAADVVGALGFYPVRVSLDVLKAMEIFSQAILFLGLIFDMIILLFIALSVLLIYSLLMISVESKTFEFGVMRMQGLNKSGLIYMIFL